MSPLKYGVEMMLITDTFCLYSKENPNKTAIQLKEQNITYGKLHKLINQTAHALLSLTKQARKKENTHRVAFLLDNSIEFLQLFLAAAKIGWIAVPLDTKWNKHEIETIMEKAHPDVLITQEKYVDKLSNISSDFPFIIIERNGESSKLSGNTRVPFKQLVHQQLDCEPSIPKVSKHAPFYMGFTSGTTGTPKAYTRSHHSWVESFNGSHVEFGLDSNDHVLVPGPLVHSLFLYASIHTLSIGGTVHLLEKFSAPKVVEALSERAITVVYGVPTMFEAIFHFIHKHSEYRKPPTHFRTIISSGAKWSPVSKQQFASIFPDVSLFEFYGASELSFVTVLDPKGNAEKPDSVGRPFHHVKISLRDAEGKKVKPGEVGKLYIHSKMVFSGYDQNEAETKRVLQDGWATVGDFARQDEEGYIYIVGREKNMIIYGGLNVFPEEVETVLLQLPDINEAAVVGVSDEYWGEKIVAFIKFKEGKQLKKREIQSFCRKQLAHYKCPREVIFVHTFPYTSSGKIARNTLKEWIETGKQDFYE